MRIFKTTLFSRYASRQRISDAKLLAASKTAEAPYLQHLGSGVIRQRVQRRKGEAPHHRTVLATRDRARTVYFFGFEADDEVQLGKRTLGGCRKLAEIFSGLSDADIAALLKAGAIEEVQ